MAIGNGCGKTSQLLATTNYRNFRYELRKGDTPLLMGRALGVEECPLMTPDS